MVIKLPTVLTKYRITGTLAHYRWSSAISATRELAKKIDDGEKASPSISLSKLPKAQKYTSIVTKGVLPGHTDFLWSRNASICLDPSHPIHKHPSRVVFQSPSITVRMVPYGALAPFGSSFSRAQNPFPEKYQKRPPPNRVPLALGLITAIAVTHKSSVTRTIIRRKIREALKLIIARGVAAGERPGTIIVRNEDIGAERWLLKDWAYIIYPTLAIHEKPMPELIMEIRQALEDVKGQAMKLEDKWKAQVPAGSSARRPARSKNVKGRVVRHDE